MYIYMEMSAILSRDANLLISFMKVWKEYFSRENICVYPIFKSFKWFNDKAPGVATGDMPYYISIDP